MLKVQLIFNGKYFMVRNFSRLKFMRIGCLQTFGEKVAWTDAVMVGKFESHFTGCHHMFARSIPEKERLKTVLSSKKVAITEYSGQETWTEFCPTIISGNTIIGLPKLTSTSYHACYLFHFLWSVVLQFKCLLTIRV